VCTPESNTSFCSRLGKNCGSVTGTDNCGVSRTVSSCGTCTSPATCGGGGTPNVCGGSSCTPESNTSFCSRLGKNCGSVTGTDNCGVSRTVSSCGTCTSPATCGGGGTPNVCGTSGGGGGGNFPSRFAAPYVATWNNNNLVNLSNGTGHKFWTLAFIINGSGSCNPMWNGDTSLTGNSYGTYITNLRGIGGDVIVSFGGASGTEIAKSCPDVATTQAAYQKVINQFKLTWIDLDIESGQESDTASVDRRNKAMKNLQAANPGLRISYTLAVDRSGLPSGPRNLLANAKANGVNVTTVNIMAMDYGPCYSDMGQAAIDAANATRTQLANLGLNAKVGVTPMIGTNDITCEKFTTTDASILVNWAKANSFVNLLAYWVQDADSSHSYINIFKTFP
jgi:chitinase